MATEYGYRTNDGQDVWGTLSRDRAEVMCKVHDFTLIAREVSEPRIVSIRA